MITNLMLIEFDDPFDIVTEGVAILEYWTKYEVEYADPYLLCAKMVHPYVGGWDTPLAKRECLFL
jgi:hypothetical protein